MLFYHEHGVLCRPSWESMMTFNHPNFFIKKCTSEAGVNISQLVIIYAESTKLNQSAKYQMFLNRSVRYLGLHFKIHRWHNCVPGLLWKLTTLSFPSPCFYLVNVNPSGQNFTNTTLCIAKYTYNTSRNVFTQVYYCMLGIFHCSSIVLHI